jgi:hypothetical protein
VTRSPSGEPSAIGSSQGSVERHFSTTLPEAQDAARRMWAWLGGDPNWGAGIDWNRVQF